MNRRHLLKLLLAVPTATLFPKPVLPKLIGAVDLSYSARDYIGTTKWVVNTEWAHVGNHSSTKWLMTANWDKEIWLGPLPARDPGLGK